jgi:hypothetical protein
LGDSGGFGERFCTLGDLSAAYGHYAGQFGRMSSVKSTDGIAFGANLKARQQFSIINPSKDKGILN